MTIYHWKESSDQFLNYTEVSLIINLLGLLSTCTIKKIHKQTKIVKFQLKDYLMQLFVALLFVTVAMSLQKEYIFQGNIAHKMTLKEEKRQKSTIHVTPLKISVHVHLVQLISTAMSASTT